MVSRMILLINIIRKIAYRSTEKKTLVCNAAIKFKLSNSVRISVFINCFSPVISLHLNKTFFRWLINIIVRGKIKIKVRLVCWFNPNSCACRVKRVLLVFELSYYLTIQYLFTININKSLANEINCQLNLKKWIKIK